MRLASTPSLPRYNQTPLSGHSRPGVLSTSLSQPHFGKQGKTEAFGGLSALGLLGALFGLGLSVYGHSGKTETAPVPARTVLEQKLEDSETQAKKDVSRGKLFDEARGTVKNWTWRLITGDRVGHETVVNDDGKLDKNALTTQEDHMMEVLGIIAGQSGNPEVVDAFRKSMGRVQATQSDYYEARANLKSLESQQEPGFIGKLVYGSLEDQKKAARDILEHDDRAGFDALTQHLHAAEGANSMSEYREFTETFVNTIVAKYEPEKVEISLKALDEIFDSIEANQKANRDATASFETRQQARAEVAAAFDKWALRLGGTGLAGFLIFGLACKVAMENEKQRF